MHTRLIILLAIVLFFQSAVGQKSKGKRSKTEDRGPKVTDAYDEGLRKDSIVYYQTEVGYVMPDLSPKFKGRWIINVMRRQAKAAPDSLSNSYIEFYGDTLFTAYVGCNKLSGKYIIKGPTIKFHIIDSLVTECPNAEIETWFIRLMQERVSYFGVDEKLLLLKDVAANIVFDCARSKEEEPKAASQ